MSIGKLNEFLEYAFAGVTFKPWHMHLECF